MRKYILVLALLFAVGGMVCGTAQAQCTVDTSGYAVYYSVSGNNFQSTTADILTSVVVDGSASMSGSCGDLTYVTHAPQIVSVLNGVGSWTYPDGSCASCYLSAEVDQDSGAVPLGVEYPFSFLGQVVCSAAGTILSVNGGDDGVKGTVTTYKYASVSLFICRYNVNCGNRNPTCGADHIYMAAPCPRMYITLGFIVERNGLKTTCHLTGPAASADVPVPCS